MNPVLDLNKFCDTFCGITSDPFLDISFNGSIYILCNSTHWLWLMTSLWHPLKLKLLFFSTWSDATPYPFNHAYGITLQLPHIKYVGRVSMWKNETWSFKRCQISSDLKSLPSIQQNVSRVYMFRNRTENFPGNRCSFFPGLNCC